MKTLRSAFAWLLILSLCLGLLPLSALAVEEKQTEALAESAPTEEFPDGFVYVNPLYADIVDPEDIPLAPDRPAVDGSPMLALPYQAEEPLNDGVVFTDTTSLANTLRPLVAKHTQTLQFSYWIQDGNQMNDAVLEAMNLVIYTHTGNGKEGDAIRWTYAGYSTKWNYYRENGGYHFDITITVSYYSSAEQEAILDTKVQEILTSLNLSGKNNYEKVKAIYDYLTSHVVYDYDRMYDTSYTLKYTAYAALVDGIAVCQGYSVAFYRLCLECGIDARIAIGRELGHAWNIVGLDGYYYECDSTWDAGSVKYTYFLRGRIFWMGAHNNGTAYSSLGDNWNDSDFANTYIVPDGDYVPPGAETYTITYHFLFGATNPNPGSYNTANDLVLVNPVRPGYRFVGWNTDPQFLGSIVKCIPAGSSGDKDFFAQWEAKTYTVSFNGNGATGGTVSSQTCTYDETFKLAANRFRKTGYHFVCWNTEADGSGLDYASNSGAANLCEGGTITLYAIWEPNSYSLRFDANGGSGEMDALTLIYDEEQTLPDCGYSYSGRSFVAWNSESDGSGTAYNPGSVVKNLSVLNNDSLTLYAIWAKGVYTVLFDPNGGSGSMNELRCGSDETVVLPKCGYTRAMAIFTGWNTEPDGTGESYIDEAEVVNLAENKGSIKLYAQWQECSFTVQYFPNGGSGDMSGQTTFVKIDSDYCLADCAFTREGYDFIGWSTESSGGSLLPSGTAGSALNAENGAVVKLYAQWKPHSYKIVFNPNGGSGDMSAQSLNYGESAKLTKNGFSRSYATFIGWNTRSDGKGLSFADEQSVQNLSAENEAVIDLYAQWELKHYSVVYMPNGGSGDMSARNLTLDMDAAFTLPDCAYTRTGYTFVGWGLSSESDTILFSGEEASTLSETDGATVSLYAIWRENIYSVAFRANGGTGAMSSLSLCYGESRALPLNSFTRDHAEFLCWNTKSDGSGTKYENGASILNLTTEDGAGVELYAQWKVEDYQLSYYANGGSGDMSAASVTLRWNESYCIAPCAFTRVGYNFTGWNTQADGKGASYSAEDWVMGLSAGGEVRLYAQWEPILYNLTIYPNGGSGKGQSMVLTYDQSATIPENPFTRTHYSFAGWALSESGEAVYQGGETVMNLTTGESVALYALWMPNSYSIRLHANGGSGEQDGRVYSYLWDRDEQLPLCTMEKLGYDFLGWAIAPTEEAIYSDGGRIRNAVEDGRTLDLYALWGLGSYTIAFDGNGGSGSMKTVSCVSDKTYTLASNSFRRNGYTFGGWLDSKGTLYPNRAKVYALGHGGKTVVLSAKWLPNSYTITYKNVKSEDNNPAPTVFTPDDETIVLPTLYREGWVFGGWYRDSRFRNPISEIPSGTVGRQTVYAKFTPNSYTVSFEPNGADSGSMKTQTGYCNKALSLTSCGFKRTGYTFVGWNTLPDGSGESYANRQRLSFLTEDGAHFTFYAQWKCISYAISYKGLNRDEANPNPVSYTIEDSFTLLALERAGYAFEGWYSDSRYQNPVTELTVGNTGKLTLYAKWRTFYYTVNYDGNGADSGTMKSVRMKCADTLSVPGSSYKRTGYSFAGWNTMPDGSGVSYVSRERVRGLCWEEDGSVTLYAQWTLQPIKVTYRNILATDTNPNPATFDVEHSFVLQEPSRAGSVFRGWYLDSRFLESVTAVEGKTPITVYAQWD